MHRHAADPAGKNITENLLIVDWDKTYQHFKHVLCESFSKRSSRLEAWVAVKELISSYHNGYIRSCPVSWFVLLRGVQMRSKVGFTQPCQHFWSAGQKNENKNGQDYYGSRR